MVRKPHTVRNLQKEYKYLPHEENTMNVEHTRVTMIKQIQGGACNEKDELSLGVLLRWLDACSCMSAERLAGRCCVTMVMDDLTLEKATRRPKKGEYCILDGVVTKAWGSSLEVRVSARIGSLRKEQDDVFCSVHFVYVIHKTQEEREKKIRVKLPKFEAITDAEQQDLKNADQRRQMRFKREAMVAELAEKSAAEPSIPPLLEPAMSVLESACQEASKSADTTDQTSIQFWELVLPSHANHMGNTFGGQIMCWMSKAAVQSAWKHIVTSGSIGKDTILGIHLLPVCIDQILFKEASHVGDRLRFKASVCRVFHTTMEVYVQVEGSAVGEAPKLINEGYFTYVLVASSKGGVKKPRADLMPPFVPGGKHAIEQYKLAMGRRKLRMKRVAVGLALDLFERIDKDGDGALTVDELHAAIAGDPKVSKYFKRSGMESIFTDLARASSTGSSLGKIRLGDFKKLFSE